MNKEIKLTDAELKILEWLWFEGTKDGIYKDWRDKVDFVNLYNKLFK